MFVRLTFKLLVSRLGQALRARSLCMGGLCAVVWVAGNATMAAAQSARGPAASSGGVPGATTGSIAGQSTKRAAADAVTFVSPEAAYDYGRSALQGGNPEMAIKGFEFAAENDMFLAQYFLARIYADNTVSYTNHGRAFELYQQIATDHADVDPDDDPRAPFVAKAMIALAGYYRTGIANAGVAPDLEQAANLLRNAAKSFRDEDGQYEFAKLLLTGEGVAANPREALYWLRNLSTHGHTSAQAFLADLYWRGLHVAKDQTQALLLITLAAENAPNADRVWIEDKYQNIFCGAGEGVRRQAQGAVADWRTKYARAKEERSSRDGLTAISPRAVRTCSNGETAVPDRRGGMTVEQAKPRTEIGTGFAPAPMPQAGTASNGGLGQGSALGFSMRDAGQTTLSPAR